VVVVTLLTSLDPADMPPGFALPFRLAEAQAEMLAAAERAGARSLVCSAADLAGIRERRPAPSTAVSPSNPAAGASANDQRRVTTIAEAVASGSSLLVLGRAITSAPDPRAALESARAELAATIRA